MIDLNWNEIICSRFEDDNLLNYHSVFLQSKDQITEKQKDYIKN
ncbi:hypothetical protein [Spiroplasma citri]|nr:hypothetical protein [Spiroplasma citri]